MVERSLLCHWEYREGERSVDTESEYLRDEECMYMFVNNRRNISFDGLFFTDDFRIDTIRQAAKFACK